MSPRRSRIGARIAGVQDTVDIIAAYTHLIMSDASMGRGSLTPRTHAMLGRILVSTAQVQKSLGALVDDLTGPSAADRPMPSSPVVRRS